MDLRHLTDATLLTDIRTLAGKEREITVKILHHLKEIDRRKLYSNLKFNSLYEYCIKELSYSEGSAHRRIVAARLLNEFPDIQTKIESGRLSLINIAQVSKYIKDNNIKDPDVKKNILKQVESLSKKECDQKLFELTGSDRPRTTTLTILDETFVKLQQVRGLLGQILNIDELIILLSESMTEKIEREKFKQTGKTKSPPPVEVKRVIPANIKRVVYKRDKKCVKCGGSHNLQFDHRKPYALGGKSTVENVRLLCFNCNQRSRITAKL